MAKEGTMETLGQVTAVVLLVGAAFAAATLAREIPGMRRYLHIRRM
jgi:hypothetical protein